MSGIHGAPATPRGRPCGILRILVISIILRFLIMAILARGISRSIEAEVPEEAVEAAKLYDDEEEDDKQLILFQR